MLCENPFLVAGTLPVGCGKCLACLTKRRRMWSSRIMLESYKHASNSFLTLTYDDAHLPENGSLVPRDTQLWIKRFRKVIAPVTLRYFLCGEYGDKSRRPHYHAALFGIGPEYQDLVQQTWGKGHVMLGDLTEHSASYIAGYVTKKLRNNFQNLFVQTGPAPLDGFQLEPEFTRMSLKPGIGAGAMADVAETLLSAADVHSMEYDDVPFYLKQGRRSLLLGRYLRRKLREHMGRSPDTPDTAFYEWVEKLQTLYTDSRVDKTESFKQVLAKINGQKLRNMEARSKLYDNRNNGVL